MADDQDLTRLDPGQDVTEEGVDDHVPTQSPEESGEEEIGGTTSIPTMDDDTGEMVKKVTGEEPKREETLADIINRHEKDRITGADEEPEVGVEQPKREEGSEVDALEEEGFTRPTGEESLEDWAEQNEAEGNEGLDDHEQ
ncbi:MAG: hypothetical protein HY376_03630 [Candidatus Blackburnbacteria bacterium]|nr:hypothetical protein [Candidatus Blackburnbacteria bacterium]